MAEYDEQVERLERDAKRLDEQGEHVERHIDETQSDWESKEQDTSVPGAQPEPGEEEEGGP
jgi:chaperonin cofactor prefoldin